MRLDRLDLNLLVALDALLDERNVTAAAERLFLSQPAMSGTLKRLRDYFDDPLLIQTGRNMTLTARSESLALPIKTALALIRSSIMTPRAFDPTQDRRHFRIVASDYVFDTVLAPVFMQLATRAPNITVELNFPESDVEQRLAQGDIDLIVTLEHFMPPGDAAEFLFDEDHVAVAWKGNDRIKGRLTMDLYATLPHVTARFGNARPPAYIEYFLHKENIQRNTAFMVASFSAIAPLLVGTNRIATMMRRHAELYMKRMPLISYPVPFDMPRVREFMYWNKARGSDPALEWLQLQIREFVRGPDFAAGCGSPAGASRPTATS